jgi:hypothetical protein
MTITNTDSAGGGLIIQAGLINSSNIPLRIRNVNGIEVANIGIAGQIQTSSTISATGNITGATIQGSALTSTGTISATGNITGGNLSVTGSVTVTDSLTTTSFVSSNQIRTGAGTPTAASAGVTGTMVFNSNFLYVCIATNSWKRIALSSF